MRAHNPRLRELPNLWKNNLPRVLLRVSLVIVLIALYLASTVYNVRQERQLIQSDIERITKATTKSAQIHTQSIFDATIQNLQSLRSDINRSTDPRRAQDLLDHHFFGSPYLRTTLLLDEEGLNIASNYRELVGSAGVGYQFFEAHRNTGRNSPFTGDIIVGKVSRSPHFLSSIALKDERGQFDGVIAAAYELSHFQRLYLQFAPNTQYTVALYHEIEGLVVAGNSEITSGSLPISPGYPLHLPNYGGDFQTVDVTKTSAYPILAYSQPLSDTQFHIVTFADTSQLLGNHVRSTRFKFVLAGLFVATVIGLMIVVEWHSAGRILSEQENMKLESELRQSQKLEALGTLAGGFAHDFNNLLSSIIGFAELTRERLHLGQAADNAIQQVLLAGRRAESMVERVLTFSQRSESCNVPFELGPIAREALDLARIGLSPMTSIELHIDDEDSWMFGDPSQMHQLVTNLAVNAVHAMPDGGRLTISLRQRDMDPAETASMGLVQPGRHLELIVKDTGVGIAPEVQERMYDPFYTTKQHGKGCGLGLSIVHSIVEEHRGTIKVSSAIGNGTEFTVWIPAIDKPPGGTGSYDVSMPIQGNGGIAVFVDDEEAIVTLGEERLAELGFEPHAFTNSTDALEHIEENALHISLLITDVAMPDISGTELASRARALRPDLPIILITGFSTREIMKSAEAIGVCEVLRKPLRARKLAEAVSRSLMNRPSTQEE